MNSCFCCLLRIKAKCAEFGGWLEHFIREAKMKLEGK